MSEFYFPISVHENELVDLPAPGTLACQEVNDELLSQMQTIGRDDLTEENIDQLINNLSNKTINPWILYNQLISYVCPFQREYFRNLFDSLIKKHYVSLDEALNFLTQNHCKK